MLARHLNTSLWCLTPICQVVTHLATQWLVELHLSVPTNQALDVKTRLSRGLSLWSRTFLQYLLYMRACCSFLVGEAVTCCRLLAAVSLCMYQIWYASCRDHSRLLTNETQLFCCLHHSWQVLQLSCTSDSILMCASACVYSLLSQYHSKREPLFISHPKIYYISFFQSFHLLLFVFVPSCVNSLPSWSWELHSAAALSCIIESNF